MSKTEVVFMHVLLCPVPEGHTVDHRDGDGLNNTRANLRPATPRQQMYNRRAMPKRRPGGLKGVYFQPASKRRPGLWRYTLRLPNGKRIHRGAPTEAEAHARYCALAQEIHGEFFRAN